MARSIQTILDESNPNKAPDALHGVKAGTALAAVPRFVVGTVTSHVLTLPNNAKAAAVISAYSRAGTLTGQLTPVKNAAAVATTQVGINPAGNILFATADAVTSAEVVYMPQEGDLVTETIPVTSGGIGSPLASKNAIRLISANLVTGSSTGAKTVVARGSSPSAGEACLGNTGTILFNSTDAGASGGTATVTYIACPGVGSATPSLASRLATDANY